MRIDLSFVYNSIVGERLSFFQVGSTQSSLSLLARAQTDHGSSAPARLLNPRFSENLKLPNVDPNRSELSYQVSAIVGSYLFILLLIGLGLLLVARHHRQRLVRYTLQTRDLEIARATDQSPPRFTGDGQADFDRASVKRFDSIKDTPNFSYPPPARHSRFPSKSDISIWPTSERTSSDQFNGHVGINVSPIDNDPVVRADRAAMDRNLEDIYAHVMAQEDAKQSGSDVRSLPDVVSKDPSLTSPHWSPQSQKATTSWTSPGKIRKKPQQLHFDGSEQKYAKTASKTATFMNALKSPIRSLRTPRTGVYPRGTAPEEEPLTPRHYISGPLMPSDVSPQAHNRMASNHSIAEALSEHSSLDLSFPPTHIGEPLPSRKNDENVVANKDQGVQIDTSPGSLARQQKSDATSLRSRRMTPPMSPQTTMSTSPLSPTLAGAHMGPPGVNSTSHYIPAPISRIQHRPSPSSASTARSTLPFRQYESPISPISPTSSTSTVYNPMTKTTVLERTALLPSGPNTAALRTPWTAGAVPYSPYMPQTPVIPITPRLVTKEERRLKKKSMPRTPVVEMVSDDGEVWGDGYE